MKDGSRGNAPPGWIIAAATAAPLVALLCVYYDWPRTSIGSLGFIGTNLIVWTALPALVVAGGFWLAATLHYWDRRRSWSWRIAVAPALVYATLVGGLLLPPGDFDDARPQLEQVARELLANPSSSRSDLRFGGVLISDARVQKDGNVYFVDAHNSDFSMVGWVFAPDGPPTGRRWVELKDLGGHWYRYEYGT